MSEEPLNDELDNCLEGIAEALGKMVNDAKGGKDRAIPQKQAQEKAKIELRNTFSNAFEKIRHGMAQILLFVSDLAKADRSINLEEIARDLGQLYAVGSVLADHADDYLQMVQDNRTLQEIFSIDEKTIESMYKACRFIYEQQHYEEAAAGFSVLTLLNPNYPIFWIGLGNSEFFMRNYDAALMAYAMAAQVNIHDPMCHVFSARCYELLRQNEHALNSLELALIVIEDKKEFEDLKLKILGEKIRLSQKSSQ